MSTCGILESSFSAHASEKAKAEKWQKEKEAAEKKAAKERKAASAVLCSILYFQVLYLMLRHRMRYIKIDWEAPRRNVTSKFNLEIPMTYTS